MLRKTGNTCGEALPLADATFSTIVIGWLLHHISPNVDRTTILADAFRMTSPGGRLLSVEPLRETFTQEDWRALLAKVGFTAEYVEQLYEAQQPDGSTEQHALAVCTKPT